MTRRAWKPYHQYLRDRVLEANADFTGIRTYGLRCPCGHQGIVKMTDEQAARSTFKCRKCGRKQTRKHALAGT